ncbi:MAG: putative toxin-antitoxin system toxin component, PIN family [Verrucomicrobiota bacterium]|nr:putative toxin-antitoxin system toxin component, PIN family [Chthoniobacterales bacterium]MDQ3414350.1 putative toxin-antitoxin system toxin component, PIN family [Verrucomicrobiota bacterium]
MKAPPSWVLDTNVLISGLLNAHGFPGRLVDAILSGTLRMTYDDRIEREYREVLARPKFRFPARLRGAFLLELRNQDAVAAAIWPGHGKLPDPADLPFLEVARYATDRILVTGNTRHYPAASRGDVLIVSPAQAWERLAAI